MTDLHANLPEVDALLAERDALHAWLARLAAAPVSAPSAVRDRVRADYQQRLDGVTDALRSHADTLAERLATDRAERAELDQEASASREALAEAELRHAVGEYDASRFEVERLRHTSDLETFELSLMAVDERIDRLEGIAAAVSAAPARAPESVTSAPPQGESEDAPELPMEARGAASEAEQDTSMPVADAVEEETSEDDTLDSDALLAVFGIDGAPQPFVPEPPPSDAAPLSFTPSGAPPSTPPRGMPMADPPRFSPPARPTTPPSPAGREPEMMVHDVPDRRAEPAEPEATDAGARTVRCEECGAMNRPLEWYCEKCGAELTTM